MSFCRSFSDFFFKKIQIDPPRVPFDLREEDRLLFFVDRDNVDLVFVSPLPIGPDSGILFGRFEFFDKEPFEEFPAEGGVITQDDLFEIIEILYLDRAAVFVDETEPEIEESVDLSNIKHY